MIYASCGLHHSLIINNEYKIYSFGYNNRGQLGLGDTTNRNTPTLINYIFDSIPIKIQQGYYYTIVLTNLGKVYSFGDNEFGQLGLGDITNRNRPTLINYSFDGIPVSIQQGQNYSMILTNTGKVYSFGLNNYGQLGLGDTTNRTTPTLINYQFDGKPIDIQAGLYHSMILTDTGKVYSFGDNQYGQLGLGDTTNRTTPTLINYSFDGIPIYISQGVWYSLILTDTGKVYSFGRNNYGQLGLGNTTNRNTPTLINESFNGIPISIQSGWNHSFILTDNDKIYVTGYNYYGQLGLGDTNNRNTPTLINYSFDGIPIKIQQGGNHSLILTDNNKIYSVGYNRYGQLGLGDNIDRYLFSDVILEGYNLSIFQEPPNGGIIELNGQEIETPYLKKIEKNTNIIVTQIPSEGYEFLEWKDE